jgi:hypothetical protein
MLPGGDGGGVYIALEPGQLVNRGLIAAGSGGPAHPDAEPGQAGGRGGDVTLLGTSLMRLDGSEVRAGAGGTGSRSNLDGPDGVVGVAAVRVSHVDTNFSRGAVEIVESGDTTFGFSVLGPSLIVGRVGGGDAIATLRIFNRSARQETYLVTAVTTPSGWRFLDLPATVTIPAFKSQALGLRIRPPNAEEASTSEWVALAGTNEPHVGDAIAHLHRLSAQVRVTAQRNAALRSNVPIGIVSGFGLTGARLHLPFVSVVPRANAAEAVSPLEAGDADAAPQGAALDEANADVEGAPTLDQTGDPVSADGISADGISGDEISGDEIRGDGISGDELDAEPQRKLFAPVLRDDES